MKRSSSPLRRWLTGALFLLATLMAMPLAAQRLEAGLVAHYPLDGNLEEATDVVGTAVSRGSLEYASGAIGRAARLSGDDEIDFNGIPNATFGGDFTVAWFMQVTRSAAYSFFGKQAACDTTSNYFTTHIDARAPDDVRFELRSSSSGGVATAPLPFGKWVHVAVVRRGSQAMVYVNGQASSARSLPALSLGEITAPFGLGNSPCIGTLLPGAPLRPIGLFDEVRVYNLALAPDVIADLARRPVFSATPKAASVGGSVTVRASHLVVGRTYELVLRDSRSSTTSLFSGRATATSMSWPITLPALATGDYSLQLRTAQLRFNTVERETALQVVPRLSIAASAPLQAGKPATFTVGNLARGSVRLIYANRIVAGPALVDGSSHTFKLTLPSDIPASLPANVALRAELLDGKTASRIGTSQAAVAAPFTGKFVTLPTLSSTRTVAKPEESVALRGKFDFADGTTARDTTVSAYWIGDNGDVTPLPTEALALDDAGNVQLDTRPPSRSAMTAIVPESGGHIRIVAERTNAHGRREWMMQDGPSLDTTFDYDADTDITVRVQVRGTNGLQPLEGAYVVVDSAAPLGYAYDTPTGSSGDSGEPVSGGSAYRQHRPALALISTEGAKRGQRFVDGPAVNQVNNAVSEIPPPPPPFCGENLYRRYTDAAGRASFPVLGGPEEQPQSWQNVMAMSEGAVQCSTAGCSSAAVDSDYRFYLTIYTLHLGAGRRNQASNAEVPTRFRIDYDRDEEEFRIENLRTHQVSVQQVSANIDVEVTQIAQQNYITIADPFMFHEIGGQPQGLVAKHDGGFGKWIDFSDTRVTSFSNVSPTKVMRFSHKPDANGPLLSAKLYLNRIDGNGGSFIGEFRRINFVDGCNLQEDPSTRGTETWELKSSPDFATSWRYPKDIFFAAGAERRACGYIQMANAANGDVRRNVCFHWQAAPGFMYEEGGALVVNDADINNVLIERAATQRGNQATTVRKRTADFFGEPIDKPGRIDNSSRASEGVYAAVGSSGENSGARKLTGANPEQFSEGAAGDDASTNFAQGQDHIEFGDDEYETILDVTVPLFQWYWGVPEVLSAEVYAKLRLFASYMFNGSLTRTQQGEELDLFTNAVFGAMIMIGVDIDVLFGFILDAGAGLSGLIHSEMPIVVQDNQTQEEQPCITFNLRFDGYVDPCPLCPTPVISFGDDILTEHVPEGCGFFSLDKGSPEVAKLAKADDTRFGFAEARPLRLHPALAFDTHGNGHFARLDDDRHLAISTMTGDDVAPPIVVSTAMGIRDAEIAYFDADRAVAVWAESDMDEATYIATASRLVVASAATLARRQRLVYSEWDGETWGAKQILTPAGLGEGQVGLTACPDDQAGCPAGGEVIAIWQRDENADFSNPRFRLFHSRYRPATGFGAAAPLDPTPAPATQDITPDVAYLNGRAVVVWTRQFGTSLNDFQQRNLAYRVLPDGAATVVGSALGATAPSVVASGNSHIRVAYLRADPNTSPNPGAANKGAIGTQHALHVASASCGATSCTFPNGLIPPTHDQVGRRIYGERPNLVQGEDDALVIMRAFRFEGENGEPVQSGDAIGTVLSSGDLLSIAPNYITYVARVTPITADGAMHLSAVAAYNPANRSIYTGSTVYLPDIFIPLQAALKATGHKGHIAYGKAVAAAGPLELHAMIAAPDLGVERIEANTALAPGSAQSTTIKVGNRGTGFVRARDGSVNLQLRWNSAGGPLLASVAVPDIDSGGERDVTIPWTAPADAFDDETHTLYAVFDTPDGFDEITDDNNTASHTYPGLPTPQHVGSSSIPGVPQVQLGWDPIDDARIAGYRVYRQATDGSWTPMGASPVHGFLDLSASFYLPRTYAVTSYSRRGIESARSAALTAMPVPAGFIEPFRDGFEGSASENPTRR